MTPDLLTTGSYNYGLMVLSILIAKLASYAQINLDYATQIRSLTLGNQADSTEVPCPMAGQLI